MYEAYGIMAPHLEVPPHIPEYCPFRLQPKQFHVIFHTLSPSLPAPTHTSHHNHISTAGHPIIHTFPDHTFLIQSNILDPNKPFVGMIILNIALLAANYHKLSLVTLNVTEVEIETADWFCCFKGTDIIFMPGSWCNFLFLIIMNFETFQFKTEWQYFLAECLEIIAKVTQLYPNETFGRLVSDFFIVDSD